VGEDPDRIRREIEATRNEMGETVDALTYKADVRSRAKESLMATKDSIKSKVVGASGATPDGEQVQEKARRAAGMAQENPLGLAIGAVAAGFIVGLLLPSSSVEDRKLGPVADDVKEKAKETGQEALERGQQVVQEAAQSAQETVQEKGREHGEQLADSARHNVQEATSSAPSARPRR
jgi:gas vesicle protein